jgi:hypothetical protein
MPHRGPRHARPIETAVGLGRRTPTKPERLPSDRPRSRDPVDKVAFVVHARRLCLTPCRSPRARPASSKAGKSLRAIPPLPGSSRVAPRLTVPARKMRLSDFCNRPTTRAPCTLPDSRLRSPSAARSCDPTTFQLAPTHPRRPDPACALSSTPMMNHQVEPRLTANLQLQLRHNPPDRPPRSRSPDSPAWFEHRAFLGKLRSKAPPRRASRSWLYRPPTGHAAIPLTSSVATAPLELDLSASPALAAARLRFHSRLVKDDRFVGTRAPSADDCSPTSAIRTAHEHNHEPSDPGSTSPTWLAQLALDR